MFFTVTSVVVTMHSMTCEDSRVRCRYTLAQPHIYAATCMKTSSSLTHAPGLLVVCILFVECKTADGDQWWESPPGMRLSTKYSPPSIICRGPSPSSIMAHHTSESSSGSGTPTMRDGSIDGTTTGLSAVPNGACSLCMDVVICAVTAACVPALLPHVNALDFALQLIPVRVVLLVTYTHPYALFQARDMAKLLDVGDLAGARCKGTLGMQRCCPGCHLIMCTCDTCTTAVFHVRMQQ